MVLTIDRIVTLLETRGREQYGTEPVSQTEHALQCATYAVSVRESAELIAACLLHDLGHLLHGYGDYHLDDGINDTHEDIAFAHLRPLFPDAVLQPIRLHVDAKRYLCAVEAGYQESLSPASQHSLELQGGAFTGDEARQFILQPYARDAVKLRRWDDQAKVPGKHTPSVFHIAEWMHACALLDWPSVGKFYMAL
jgi:phosphonate degradation associated HDIG domain protein